MGPNDREHEGRVDGSLLGELEGLNDGAHEGRADGTSLVFVGADVGKLEDAVRELLVEGAVLVDAGWLLL